MINVCDNCGIYRVEKIIEEADEAAGKAVAVCPVCGHRHPFRYLPLRIVAGASGTGKTAVCRRLLGSVPGWIIIEFDILWQEAFNQPENNHHTFFEVWLRMCKNIHQSGVPVTVFGAGFGVPSNIEPCLERRYFSSVHYLALTCKLDELTRRLRVRPAWRGVDEAFIRSQLEFNRWFIETGSHGHPAVELLDTTKISLEETVALVLEWIKG